MTRKNQHPSWLRYKIPMGRTFFHFRQVLRERGLHTICEAGSCPNIHECWNKRSATFLILGDICTRACRFCGVEKGYPRPVEPAEPLQVARVIQEMGLKYAVITSVTRDDLSDGGSTVFVKTLTAIRDRLKGIKIEVLVPDFKGDLAQVQAILEAKPDVFGHNVEMVPALYSQIRPNSSYQTSLQILDFAGRSGKSQVKTGIMVGLGESMSEVKETLKDIRQTGCQMVTIGQYLQPSRKAVRVSRFYPPEELAALQAFSQEIGFTYVMAGTKVRSSYYAEASFFPEGFEVK